MRPKPVVRTVEDRLDRIAGHEAGLDALGTVSGADRERTAMVDTSV
ncbi:MAG TPA: hypothetical protein VH120_17855 [Gemmataceae bacterium]|jgi:hypothetical protein|nr:hypothetical protein [Gemmataceae bacterium]